MDKDRVQRLMKAHGIKAQGRRKFVVTTYSKHSLPVAENLLARDFHPSEPDRVWSSDCPGQVISDIPISCLIAD